jgi:hypothetical protein
VPDERGLTSQSPLPCQKPLDVAKGDNDQEVNCDTFYQRLLDLVARARKTSP